MAEFSKQYVERQFEDPEFAWDFDIEEIGKDLQNDHIHPMICEGYGFLGVFKNQKGEIELAFEHPTEDLGLEMVPYDQLDKRYREGSLPWQRMKGV
jgi:hypothetical protein